MAIRIGKTIDMPTLNAMSKAEAAFRELGEMFAGERGERAKAAAVAIEEAMIAFDLKTSIDESTDE